MSDAERQTCGCGRPVRYQVPPECGSWACSKHARCRQIKNICGCRIGECESKPTGCRMVEEARRRDHEAM